MRDSESFDGFYAGSVRRVTSHVHALTGNRAEAEDLVQEAYARAWQHWEKVSRYADPEAWVRGVAFRARVSAWRKARSRLRAHRRHGAPENGAELTPDYVAIVSGLRKLPVGQRQALVLHYLVGLTLEEISQQTGVAVGTVKSQLSRGRKALAGHLSEDISIFDADRQEVRRD